jgi:hypothetical protein
VWRYAKSSEGLSSRKWGIIDKEGMRDDELDWIGLVELQLSVNDDDGGRCSADGGGMEERNGWAITCGPGRHSDRGVK